MRVSNSGRPRTKWKEGRYEKDSREGVDTDTKVARPGEERREKTFFWTSSESLHHCEADVQMQIDGITGPVLLAQSYGD
jgi:hypothetical protein